MNKLQTTFLITLATALCVGCSHKPPIQKPVDAPMDEVSVLKGANVREASVLWTQDSVGGAAERQSEWADYLYDDHHRGVGVKAKDAPLPPPPPVAKEDAKKGDSAKDKSIYAKDKSIYSKDRSIYSKERSIYAKPKAKRPHAKKHQPPKKAVAPTLVKRVEPQKAEPKKLATSPSPVAKIQAKPVGETKVEVKKEVKAEVKKELKKPKTMPRPKLMKTPNLKAVQTTTVDGKKVSPTITELKDVPVKDAKSTK